MEPTEKRSMSWRPRAKASRRVSSGGRSAHEAGRVERGASQRGFGLIEAVIAMFVFTFGSLGLVRLLTASAEGTTTSAKLTHASTLGRSKLDELMTLPYDDALLAPGVHTEGTQNIGVSGMPFDSKGNATDAFGSRDGSYARSWTVTENGDGDFKTIEVTLEWWDESFKRMRRVAVTGGRSEQ